MSTYSECKDLEKQLEEMRKQYLDENAPCTNDTCSFYNERHENNCSWYHYQADECRDYKSE